MGLNNSAVFLPGRGIPFVAAPDTAPPDYKTMTPANPGPGWTALGHTSRENNASYTKNGGEAETKGTWWTPALRTTYSPVNWLLTVNSLQIDRDTLDLAFNGTVDPDDHGYIVPSAITAVERALFILAVDGTDRMGLYNARASVTLGDAPSFDPAAFLEVPLSASILDSDELGGIMKWYHPALEPPVITSALPTARGAGQNVTLLGSGLGSVTAVTIGGTPVASFVPDGNGKIIITLPAGAAGSAPIIATNPNGVSNSQAYTRAV
jgi:hypothetical protein